MKNKREKANRSPGWLHVLLLRGALSHSRNIMILIIFALHSLHVLGTHSVRLLSPIHTESLCATVLLVPLHSNPTFPFMYGLAPHG